MRVDDARETQPVAASRPPQAPVTVLPPAEKPPQPRKSRATSHDTGDWRRRYARNLAFTDLLVLIWVVFGTQIAWLGLEADVVTNTTARTEISYWMFSVALIILWALALTMNDTRSHRVVGDGVAEYKRVFDASVVLFGLVAIVAFLAKIDIARGFLLLSLPIGVLLLILSRWLWRQWLMAQRAQHRYVARVLLVGSQDSVAQIARELTRSWTAGYAVVGCCVPSGRIAGTVPGTDIPIMGNVDAIEQALEVTGADTVVVTSTDDLPPDKVKQISWSLEQGRQHLVLAPSIVDVAGPRLHTRPVSGLPLIHVETPRFSKGQLFAKRTLDLVASTLGVIVLSPVLFGLAIAVKTTSRGPVLFKQVRVGLRGETFRMLKFRSMVPDAEAMLDALDHQRDAGNEVLFKIKDDPRVTPLGRFMRRYSLDELPQLLNVIAGSMSLVGPRPSLPREVEKYTEHVHRRFLVKPGITGLWQVSGRSSLSWDQSVRLDLSYVENWSVVGDLLILMKTVRAASRPGSTAL